MERLKKKSPALKTCFTGPDDAKTASKYLDSLANSERDCIFFFFFVMTAVIKQLISDCNNLHLEKTTGSLLHGFYQKQIALLFSTEVCFKILLTYYGYQQNIF